MSDDVDHLVMANRANNVPRRAATETAPPILTGETVGVVTLRRNATAHDTAEPVRTVSAAGTHHALVMRNNGTGDKAAGAMCTPDHEPVRALTSKGHQSIVIPYGSDGIDPAVESVATVTTRDRLALLVPAGGTWATEPTIADHNPAPTQTATEARAVVFTDDDIDACRFRMFSLPEIAAAMAITHHADGRPYVVTGTTKRERMAQYGNAVTPPVMSMIVERLLEVTQAETFTDLFCGAGGSSLGAATVGGVLRLGLNHWNQAIETHATNFPDADHDCADVSALTTSQIRRYPHSDILMASPECTNHSLAKGARRRKPQPTSLFDDGPAGDDEQDRSRATMWDVPRFAEQKLIAGHPYKAIVVENVVDAFKWGADDNGQLFSAWLLAVRALGYEHEIVWANSMLAHAGHQLVPQSRDRMYVAFWLKSIRTPNLHFEPLCWCSSCATVVPGQQRFKKLLWGSTWGRFGPQYFYACPICDGPAYPGAAPAITIIDRSLPAPLIGEREELGMEPIEQNTRNRIGRGLYKITNEKPFDFKLTKRGWPLRGYTVPLVDLGNTLDTSWAEGMTVRVEHDGTPRKLSQSTATLTRRHDLAVVMPVAGNTFERTPGNRARVAAERPVDTVHGTLDRALVVPPGQNTPARSVGEPGPTQTTTTRAAVVTPDGGV